ncbi:DUF6531 domain-containing protein [Longispora albida]|uniref:DUF6531 domain-containing protein n=1 Tax=Longispora albida TaxID=203523 RepID=UPI00146D8B60|nr:DUF6531 domain-containing protein [Longispora albida]
MTAPVAVRQEGPVVQGFSEGRSRELKADRTATSTVFANPDGSKTLRTYSSPQFTASPDGRSMVASDLTWRQDASGRWVPVAGADVSVAARGDDPALETIGLGGGLSVSLRLDGAAGVTGAPEGQVMRYAGIRPGADVLLTSASWGLKEELVLQSADAGAGWLFPFTVSAGLVAMVDPDTGGVRFIDGQGTVRGEIPAPYMTDSKIDPRSGAGAMSYDVRYTIVDHNGGKALRIDIDDAWLRDPDRQYPVIVDPSLRIGADTDDTFVSTTNNGNNATASDLTVGTWNGGREKTASYVSFANDMGGRLANKYVLGASLNLYNTWSWSCDARPVTVYRATEFWDGHKLRWPGAAYDSSSPLASKSFAHGYNPCGSADAWESFPIDAQRFTTWAHGTEVSHGFVLRASDTDSKGWKRFASTQTTIRGAAPYLDVTYADNGAQYSLPSPQFSPALTGTQAGGLVVRATNWGSSTWTPKPANGDSYHLFYRVLNADGSHRAWSSWFYPSWNIGPHQTGDIPITVQPLPPGSYKLQLQMEDASRNWFASPVAEIPIKVENGPPRITGYAPGQDGIVSTLRPALWVGYDDPDGYGTARQYWFRICNGTPAAPSGCQESGTINSASWTIPAGVLSWGKQSWWQAQVGDGIASGPVSDPVYLTPITAQPEITAHLAGAPDGADVPGINPQAGNYTATYTDVSVAVTGPPLAITRTYNSQDQRTSGVFGSGWSSPLDQRIVQENDGNALVTLASGREARYGRNHDGTFVPPQGSNSTLVKNTPAGGGAVTWSLREPGGVLRTFDAAGRLAGVTDASGRKQVLISGPDGISEIIDVASGRKLRLTWASGRIATVTDDAGSVWRYIYGGPQLAQVCSPLSAQSCVSFEYTPSSFYRSLVADSNPYAYYPLSETSGTTAANIAARSAGKNDALYANVSLGQPGALQSSADKAAGFDAARGSSVALPVGMLQATGAVSLEAWFKTEPGKGGVIFAEQDQPVPATPAQHTPMYVGTDGILRAEWWTGSTTSLMKSAGRVDDGYWHHMVLSAGVDRQVLYVDGVQAAAKNGVFTHMAMTHAAIGNGAAFDWPGAPATGNFPFTGSIDDAAVYRYELSAQQVAAHYAARVTGTRLMKVTEPGPSTAAQLTYEPVTGRVSTFKDRDGAQWTLGMPATGDKTRTVTLGAQGRSQITYTYDTEHNGRMTQRADGLGTRRWEYNAAGFASRMTDPAGQITDYATDARGNVLAVSTYRDQTAATPVAQTSYRGYYLNTTDPLDPRNDQVIWQADARSSSAGDTRYRVAFDLNAAGQVTQTSEPPSPPYPVPVGEETVYSTGTEAAEGGGTVPAGLPLQHEPRDRYDPVIYKYNSKGDLVSSTDQVQLTTSYTYDMLGRATAKTLSSGGTVYGTTTTSYNALGQPVTVTEPGVTNTVTGVVHTPVTTFTYDAMGRVATQVVSDSTGGDTARTTSYTYNPAGRAAEVKNPDGTLHKQVWNTFGDVVKTTDPSGLVREYHYDDNHQLTETMATGAGVDPQNPAATRLILESRAYYDNGLLASVTTAGGRSTRSTYYTDGLLKTAERGFWDGTDFTAHATTQAEYDNAGNLTARTDPGGIRRTFAYDPHGVLIKETLDPDGLNRSTAYGLGIFGTPVSVDYYAGTQGYGGSRWVRDWAGRIQEVTTTERRDGSVSTMTDAVTKYARNPLGHITSITDPNGKVTDLTSDINGLPVSETGPARDVWTAGVLSQSARPVTVLGYNTFGELTHHKDPEGNITRADLDQAGRVTTITRPSYTPPGGQAVTPVERVAYTPGGQVASHTDPLGRTTAYVYDPHGRPTKLTGPDPDGAGSLTSPVWSAAYNRSGEQTQITDPAGALQQMAFDPLGRLQSTTVAERSGGQTSYYTTTREYDTAGYLSAITYPRGGKTGLKHNKAGELELLTDPTGRRTETAYSRGGLTSVTSIYGTANRWSNKKTVTTDFAGNELSYAEQGYGTGAINRTRSSKYDLNGQPIQITGFTGDISAYGWNPAGQLASITQKADASTPITVELGYDAAGRRSRMQDGNGNATTYGYNTLGLHSSTVEPATPAHPQPADRTWLTEYDAAGQPVKETLPGGVIRTRTFDALGRLTRETGTGADATTTDKAFAYDAAGRPTSISSPAGDITVTYNDRSLITALAGGQQATFGYDADGNLTTRTGPAGTQTTTYDLAGRITTVASPLTGTATYSYSPAGELAAIGYGGTAKASQSFTYDAFSRLTSQNVLQPGSTTATASTAYTYDNADRLLTKTTTGTTGAGASSYAYDGLGRLTSYTSPAAQVTGYTWDKASNRTTAGARTYTYDARNRLQTATGGTDPAESWIWTARGTLATHTKGSETRQETHDAFEQLRQVTTSSATTNYTYDALGRISQRNGTPFTYATLANDPIITPGPAGETVTADRDPEGRIIAQKTGTQPGRGVYTEGGHNDTTATFDPATGALTGSAAFDPYGQNTGKAGDSLTAGYQGGWTDPATGQVNAHARWYTPATGAFTSRDTWTLDPDPVTRANRYTYADSSPLNATDPTGHCGCSGSGGRRGMSQGTKDEFARLAEVAFWERVAQIVWDLNAAERGQRRADHCSRNWWHVNCGGDGQRPGPQPQPQAEPVPGAGPAPVLVPGGSKPAYTPPAAVRPALTEIISPTRLVAQQLLAPGEVLTTGGIALANAAPEQAGAETAPIAAGLAAAGAPTPPGGEDSCRRNSMFQDLLGQGLESTFEGDSPGIAGSVPTPAGDCRSAKEKRNSPGIATGKGSKIGNTWLRGTEGNAGRFPSQIADQLRGQRFSTFDDFRKAFWVAVGNDAGLSSGFSPGNIGRMKNGHAPIAHTSQWNGGKSYVLHHVQPIQRGGGVYDMDNLVIVTPLYHSQILDGAYHFGK